MTATGRARGMGLARSDAPPTRAPLWDQEALIRWATMFAVGLALWVGAWYLASGKPRDTEQVAALNVGVVGLLVATAAHARWVMRSRRRVRERIVALLGPAPPEALPTVTARDDVDAPPVVELLGVDGMRFYHRPGCDLAVGRDLHPASRAVHEQAGRHPCGMCRP